MTIETLFEKSNFVPNDPQRITADEVPGLGFKVFKLARSNFKPWKEYHGDDIATVESLFEEAVTPLAEGWKKHPDALFTEILLLGGLPSGQLDKAARGICR